MQLLGPSRETDADEAFACFGFRGGLNIKDLPQELDDGDLTIALNVYLRTDGGIEMRKGMNARGSTLGSGAGKNCLRFMQLVQNGVPLATPALTLLAQIGDSLWNYDGSSQIGSTGALGTNSLPWSAVAAYDANHVLAPPPAPVTSSSGAGTTLNGTYKVAITWINASGESLGSSESTQVVASGASLAISSPASLGNALSFAYYVTAAGGAAGTETKQGVAAIGSGVALSSISAAASLPAVNTATAASDVVVICTGVGGPYIYDGSIIYTPTSYASIAGARWCTSVSGEIWFGGIPSQPNEVVGTLVGNNIEVLQNFFSLSAPVTALSLVSQYSTTGVVVGHTRGLSVIYGTGSSNFFVQDFFNPDYPDAGRCMINVGGVVWFLGATAIWMFDGQTLTRMSDKVEPWILNDPLFQSLNPGGMPPILNYPMNGNRTTSFAYFYHNRLHFWYDTNNVGYPQACLVFDMIVGGWTVFYGPALNGACLLDGFGDADPHACVVIDATKGQIYNWDVYNGLGQQGHQVTDAGQPIVAQFQTKFFKIEEPGCKKNMVRIYPELFVEIFTGLVTLTTDYGLQTATAAPSGQYAQTGIWDVSLWDQSYWAGSGPLFFQPRLEIGEATFQTQSTLSVDAATSLPFEAVAFGIKNGATDPPFQFAGVSGELVYQPRA